MDDSNVSLCVKELYELYLRCLFSNSNIFDQEVFNVLKIFSIIVYQQRLSPADAYTLKFKLIQELHTSIEKHVNEENEKKQQNNSSVKRIKPNNDNLNLVGNYFGKKIQNLHDPCQSSKMAFEASSQPYILRDSSSVKTSLIHHDSNCLSSLQNKTFENNLQRKSTFYSDGTSNVKKDKGLCSSGYTKNTLFQSKLQDSSTAFNSAVKNESSSNFSSDDPKIKIRNHKTLKCFDKKIVDMILDEIIMAEPGVTWNDIAGLECVKTTIKEAIIMPLKRPDMFSGLRSPPRGLLLFGPPGNGKTLIGKCVATESNATFFSISASSLASKWVGESEQLMRALFLLARLLQPSVIFVDELDAILSKRSENEADHSRKVKTEFLVQMDGVKTNSEPRILVIGATNRPYEIDDAARRRFVKQLYIPLPDALSRRTIVIRLLSTVSHELSEKDMNKICELTEGYSSSDIANLCREASMGPIRSIPFESLASIPLNEIRPILIEDFLCATRQVRASVSQEDLINYINWNKEFGSGC